MLWMIQSGGIGACNGHVVILVHKYAQCCG